MAGFPLHHVSIIRPLPGVCVFSKWGPRLMQHPGIATPLLTTVRSMSSSITPQRRRCYQKQTLEPLEESMGSL
jgi:hypothetical protein